MGLFERCAGARPGGRAGNHHLRRCWARSGVQLQPMAQQQQPEIEFRVRQARRQDAAEVASLCAQAFPYSNLQQRLFSWGLLRALFPLRSAADWQVQLEKAMDSKEQAAATYRALRLLAWTGGLPAAGWDEKAAAAVELLLQETGRVTADRRTLHRLRIRRAFFCLVAVDPTTGALLGTLATSLARPQAALPPPFPSNARLQLYISNVAVREDARRQGVATALLQAGERLAARWGQGGLWLHVEQSNTAGVQLYSGLGYRTVRQDPDWVPGSALLMHKPVRPAAWRSARPAGAGQVAASRVGGSGTTAAAEDSAGVAGQTRGADGVFVWEVVANEPSE